MKTTAVNKWDGGDTDCFVVLTFCVPAIERFLQDSHCVWAASTELAVPKQQPFRFNMAVYKVADSGSKRFLLI